MAPSKVNRSSWWTSPTESNVPQLENLSLRMLSIPQQQHQYRKQLGFQFHEQNSSSTQSTGESNPEVASFQKGNAYGDIITPTQSGSSGTQEKPEDGQVVSMGMQDYALHASHLDYTQSFAGIPFPYTNSSYHGLLSAYGSQAMINHPQMMGRVALPSDFVEARPIYVNAKQYHAILRRRENRARLEAQNKLSKLRKPYLHESRHLHALKRARGLGGRFLNTKKEAAAAAQEFKAHCCSNKKMSESDVVVEKT